MSQPDELVLRARRFQGLPDPRKCVAHENFHVTRVPLCTYYLFAAISSLNSGVDRGERYAVDYIEAGYTEPPFYPSTQFRLSCARMDRLLGVAGPPRSTPSIADAAVGNNWGIPRIEDGKIAEKTFVSYEIY